MAHTITINLPETADIASKLAEAREQAALNGVEFSGDDAQGSFEGKIAGTYLINGNQLELTIMKKPWVATYQLIEKKLREFFA